MPTILSKIPPELRKLTRWVCADSDSKIPMRAFEPKPASVNKPDTWGGFDEAASCIEQGRYEFAGFVFADDGFVGIDIDHAFDEDGFLDQSAYEAIRACQSYTEVSKSGDGIHIICKGKLPFRGANNRAGWEIYRDARYFLLTGKTVFYEDIRECQEAIDSIVEQHFAQQPMTNDTRSDRVKIWNAIWPEKRSGKVAIEPERDAVISGSRHLAMVSFCGQMHNAYAHHDLMLETARVANERYMEPPLPEDEIRQIVDSVARYAR